MELVQKRKGGIVYGCLAFRLNPTLLLLYRPLNESNMELFERTGPISIHEWSSPNPDPEVRFQQGYQRLQRYDNPAVSGGGPNSSAGKYSSSMQITKQ